MGRDLSQFVIDEIQRLALSKKVAPQEILKEKSILAITSKIVSLAEKAIVLKSDISKEDLVKRESEYSLGGTAYGMGLTITKGLLIAAAGIDESNVDAHSIGDHYIIYPKDPYLGAQKLLGDLKKHFGLKDLGIILTDSHTQPLRRGVIGIGLAHAGFKATQSKVGLPDLFGKPLKMTFINSLDALASAAVFTMGEGDERCPLALIEGANVEFTNEKSSPDEIHISWQDDIYRGLIEKVIGT